MRPRAMQMRNSACFQTPGWPGSSFSILSSRIHHSNLSQGPIQSLTCVTLHILHTLLFTVIANANIAIGSQDSAVGTATGYGLDGRGVGVRILAGSRIFSSPRRPDQFWGSPGLSNGYRGRFPRG
jgi:hypothetical protein